MIGCKDPSLNIGSETLSDGSFCRALSHCQHSKERAKRDPESAEKRYLDFIKKI